MWCRASTKYLSFLVLLSQETHIINSKVSCDSYPTLFVISRYSIIFLFVLAEYDTLVSIHGKRLLCGGWWGALRHPNYVGDILMMWSMASVCGLSHWVPYVFPVLHLMVLIHRTFRVETRCKNLYSSTWDRYTQIVKHRLIPRVF